MAFSRKERTRKAERGSTKWYSLKNSPLKGLWICRKKDDVMVMMMMMVKVMNKFS
jgi:hypothetical protein